jgi:hypothetical protein
MIACLWPLAVLAQRRAAAAPSAVTHSQHSRATASPAVPFANPMVRPLSTHGSRDLFLANKKTYGRRGSYGSPYGGYACCGGYVNGLADDSLPASPDVASGALQLLVQPSSTQVFIDGYYVGAIADLGGEVSVAAGAHHVELRAEGYDPVRFDVHVPVNDIIRYRTNLVVTPREIAPAPHPGVAKLFYVIPGCYAGDKPPKPAALPPGCDAKALRTVPPTNATRPVR